MREHKHGPTRRLTPGRQPTGNGFEAAWTRAAELLASKRLPGLRLVCPSCRTAGTLMSRWVAGASVKPLCVVHPDGNGRLRTCSLTRDEAVDARTRVAVGSPDILKALSMGRPFVLFSGGRDSVCTLEYVRKLARRAKAEVTALHVDTTAGFPEVEEYVKAICDRMGVPLVTVRPQHDFFEIAKKWGIPGVRSRWCCETLKVAPIRRYLAQVEGPKVVYDGIRAAESPIRATYVPIWFHPAFRCFSVSAIFNWSDEQVDAYFKRCKLPQNPTVELGCSGECWCGAYKSRADFEGLLRVHPEIFDKLVKVEKAQKGRYTYLHEKGKRVPLSSLRAAARE